MNKQSKKILPTTDDLLVPVLKAIQSLGGSGTIEEINQRVYEIESLSEKQLEIPHGSDGRTELEYRLAWARTHLKVAGFIENSARKVWALKRSDINL